MASRPSRSGSRKCFGLILNPCMLDEEVAEAMPAGYLEGGTLSRRAFGVILVYDEFKSFGKVTGRTTTLSAETSCRPEII